MKLPRLHQTMVAGSKPSDRQPLDGKATASARIPDQAWPAMDGTPTWSARALHACLEHLITSKVGHTATVTVIRAWLDGPDVFCVVYWPVFDPERVVGLRRHRHNALDQDSYTPTHHFAAPCDIDEDGVPDPVDFGSAVADYDLGEPLGRLTDGLRVDRDGVGWWGALDLDLPTAPD